MPHPGDKEVNQADQHNRRSLMYRKLLRWYHYRLNPSRRRSANTESTARSLLVLTRIHHPSRRNNLDLFSRVKRVKRVSVVMISYVQLILPPLPELKLILLCLVRIALNLTFRRPRRSRLPRAHLPQRLLNDLSPPAIHQVSPEPERRCASSLEPVLGRGVSSCILGI